jgi:hypothetical protein
VPIPKEILEPGPDDPLSLARLRAHWGTMRALRHVVLHADKPDRRLRRLAKLRYEFFSADWTPWAVLLQIRVRWPKLVFEVRPEYGGD